MTATPARTKSANVRRVGIIAFVVLVLALPLLPIPAFLITQMNYIGIDALVVLGIVLLTVAYALHYRHQHAR